MKYSRISRSFYHHSLSIWDARLTVSDHYVIKGKVPKKKDDEPSLLYTFEMRSSRANRIFR